MVAGNRDLVGVQLEDSYAALSGFSVSIILSSSGFCLGLSIVSPVCTSSSMQVYLCLSSYRVCWESIDPNFHHHWAGRENEEVGESDNWSLEDDLWEGWTSFSLDPLHQKGFEPQVWNTPAEDQTGHRQVLSQTELFKGSTGCAKQVNHHCISSL